MTGQADRSGGRSARPLEALVAVAVAAVGGRAARARRHAEPALRAIADAAAAALHVTAASIALHDPVADRLVFRAAAGPAGRGRASACRSPRTRGSPATSSRPGSRWRSPTSPSDPRFERGTAERTGLRAAIAAGRPARRRRRDHRRHGVARPARRRPVRPRRSRRRDPGRRGRHGHGPGDRPRPARPAGCSTAAAPRGGRGRRADRTAGVDDAVEPLVAEADRRSSPTSDALWRLADRIGRLRDADPDDVDLAVDWLDALLARTRRRGRSRPAALRG